MSTKIYNAFIFNSNIDELMSILYEIKTEYYQILENKLPNLNFNNWKLKKKRYPFLPSNLTWQEFKKLDFSDYLLENIIEKEKKINDYHPLNIDASIVIYFCENKIYTQFYGLDRDFQESILTKYDKFQDYNYQDNTDQSNYDWDNELWDNMSEERQLELEEDWKEREIIWNKILPDHSVPSDKGLTYEFAPIGYQLNLLCKKILNAIE